MSKTPAPLPALVAASYLHNNKLAWLLTHVEKACETCVSSFLEEKKISTSTKTKTRPGRKKLRILVRVQAVPPLLGTAHSSLNIYDQHATLSI